MDGTQTREEVGFSPVMGIRCRRLLCSRSTSVCDPLTCTALLHVAGSYVTALHPRPAKEKRGETREILKVSSSRTITIPARHLPPTPTMVTARARYSGSSQKLIVALDIGTTFSGAAYALLDPGQVPEIRSVTRHALPLTLIQYKV